MSATETRIPVTLIPGDGIGPECVTAARRIVEATGAPIDWEEAEAGAEVFKQGLAVGRAPGDDGLDRAHARRAEGPARDAGRVRREERERHPPQALRDLRERPAGARDARASTTPYSGRGIDLVVVRENVEDLYAGIEYMQTPSVAQALKLISVKGSEKIARFAFEYARSEGRT